MSQSPIKQFKRSKFEVTTKVLRNRLNKLKDLTNSQKYNMATSTKRKQ